MANESTGNTGTRDEVFNLVSVLYHSLQSAETIDKYLQDSGGQSGADSGGDLNQFFSEVKD